MYSTMVSCHEVSSQGHKNLLGGLRIVFSILLLKPITLYSACMSSESSHKFIKPLDWLE